MKGGELIPHIGVIFKVILLKLLLDMAPSPLVGNVIKRVSCVDVFVRGE